MIVEKEILEQLMRLANATRETFEALYARVEKLEAEVAELKEQSK